MMLPGPPKSQQKKKKGRDQGNPKADGKTERSMFQKDTENRIDQQKILSKQGSAGRVVPGRVHSVWSQEHLQ
jgi:hypothetical protein